MSLITQFGFVVFSVALVPLAVLLFGILRLQRALKQPAERRHGAVCRALLGMSAVIGVAPVFMFAMMSAEHAIDPAFAARSFENPEAVSPRAFFLFAIEQTLGGALFDAVEIYNLEVGVLRHRCESWIFCSSLFLYRMTVNAAGSVLLLALLTIGSNWCWRRTRAFFGFRQDRS